MRRIALAAAIATLAMPAAAHAQPKRTYLVLYKQGTSLKAAHAAIHRAGGRIVRENRAIGLATVVAARRAHIRGGAIAGIARNRSIGHAPEPPGRALEKEQGSAKGKPKPPPPPAPAAEPLSGVQWDMAMLGATPDGSYRYERGSHAVRVGVIDTGIDGTHPDIAPNFNGSLSRNFTRDDPIIDGPCDEDIDGTCDADPANVDEDGHGTHVAGTIASPLNGIGIGGVAPGVELVNLRAGQDSGYFFLQPTVDALTYAGDHGIDVVNMSYFVDPWLFNCASNPADSPAQQQEQRTIVEATQRALGYARKKGVTLVAALGNEHTDIGHPTVDEISPDYPPGTEYHRDVDNKCLTMPTEGKHVIGVSALGKRGDKAYYSNYGVEQTDVAAPGGDRRLYGTPDYNTPESRILAPMPSYVAEKELAFDPANPLIVKNCTGGPCAYYQYLQGTSMASPHAVGVAALVVARYGHKDNKLGGVKMHPGDVEKILEDTAAEHACPAENPFTYEDPVLTPDFTAFCEGNAKFNGFYGHGIVDALHVVSGKKH